MSGDVPAHIVMAKKELKLEGEDPRPILVTQTNNTWSQCTQCSQCQGQCNWGSRNCGNCKAIYYKRQDGKLIKNTTTETNMEIFPIVKGEVTLGQLLQELVSYSHIH